MSLIYRTQVLKLEDNLAAVREEENFGKKFLKVFTSKKFNYYLNNIKYDISLIFM